MLSYIIPLAVKIINYINNIIGKVYYFIHIEIFKVLE